MADDTHPPPVDSSTVSVGVGSISPLKNFVAGGVGGMCLVMAGHPFDTIKVRLQTAPTTINPKLAEMGLNTPHTSYSGALDCFRKTLAHEGILGFYKGMASPLLMVTPIFALGFFGYSVGKKVVTYVSPTQEKGEMHSPLQLFSAGAISSFFTVLVITPVERIKCLLQVQTENVAPSQKLYRGPYDCGKKLLKVGGIPSLFRGFGATFVRGVPQSGLYFMTYDMLKHQFSKTGPLTPAKTIIAGGLTGIINWVFVLPLDVVKNRIQAAPDGHYPRGARDAWPELIKTEGIRGMYKGMVPVFIRAFPANAACFLGYETAIKVINFLRL